MEPDKKEIPAACSQRPSEPNDEKLYKAGTSSSSTHSLQRSKHLDDNSSKQKIESPSQSKDHSPNKEKPRYDSDRNSSNYDRGQMRDKRFSNTRDKPTGSKRYGEMKYTKTEPVISFCVNLTHLNDNAVDNSKSKEQPVEKNLQQPSDKSDTGKDETKEKSPDSVSSKSRYKKRKSYIEASKLSFPPDELYTDEMRLSIEENKRTNENRFEVEAFSKPDASKQQTRDQNVIVNSEPQELQAEQMCLLENTESRENISAIEESSKEEPTKCDIEPKEEELSIKRETLESVNFSRKWDDDDMELPFCNKPNPAASSEIKTEGNDNALKEKHASFNSSDEETTNRMQDEFGRSIFKNPSPPPNINVCAENLLSSSAETSKSLKQSETITKIPPAVERLTKMPKTPLFGIEDIYEQFVKNVKTCTGIDIDKKTSGTDAASGMSELSTPLKSTSSSSASSSSSDSDESDTSSTSSTSSSSSSSSTSSNTTSTSRSSSSNIDSKHNSNMEAVVKANAINQKDLSPKSLKELKILETLKKTRTVFAKIEKPDGGMHKDTFSKCLNELEKSVQFAESNSIEHMVQKVQIKLEPNASPVRVLLTEREIKKEVDSSDEDVNSSTVKGAADPNAERQETKSASTPLVNHAEMLSVNREAIKIKISPHSKKQVKASKPKVNNENMELEDVDFTEKLLKTTKLPTKDIEHEVERKIAKRRLSVSPYEDRNVSTHPRGSSPNSTREPLKSKESNVRATSESPSDQRDKRSLSGSPKSKKKSYSSRHSKRGYSPPPPRRSRHDSPSPRRHNDSYRSRRRSVSPTRRRSRSPYYDRRKYSRSPSYRPPSPKEKSPSKERRSSVSPHSNDTSSCYRNDPSMQYSSHDYYYLQHNEMPPDQNPEHEQYSDFYANYDYNNSSTEYINSGMSEYPQYYTNMVDQSQYSQIPVIGQNSSNYYYDDYEQGPSSFHTTPASANEIVHHDDITGKSSTVAVQKGNVLEIVPASITATAPVPPPEPIRKEMDTQTENIEDLGHEQDGTLKDTIVKEEDEEKKIEAKEKRRERKNKRKLLRKAIRSTFQEEISRRLSICTLNRINKESDGVRGILVNQTNSPIASGKEKKKVLFADGIPPGHSSSASDDETIQKRILKKRLKKKRKKEENKENKMKLDSADDTLDAEIDPELENLPPPPPPPGSPPRQLPQPVLKKPPSPEQLVYYHYDIVVDSMFISTNPLPIPPRLQNQAEAVKNQSGQRTGGVPQTIANASINKVSFSNVGKVAANSPSQIVKKKSGLEPKDGSPKLSQSSQAQAAQNIVAQGSTIPANSPTVSSPVVRSNVNFSPNVFNHPPPYNHPSRLQSSNTGSQHGSPNPTAQAMISSGNSNRTAPQMRSTMRPVGPIAMSAVIPGSPSGLNTSQRPNTLTSHGSPLVSSFGHSMSPSSQSTPGSSPKQPNTSPLVQAHSGYLGMPTMLSPGSAGGPSQSPGQAYGSGVIHNPHSAPGPTMIRTRCPSYGPGMPSSHGPPVRVSSMMRGPNPIQNSNVGFGPAQNPVPGQPRPRFPPRMIDPSAQRNPYPMSMQNPQMNMPGPQMQYPARYPDPNTGKYPEHFSAPNYNPNIPPPYSKNRMPRQKFHSRPHQSFNTEIRPQNFNTEIRPQNFRTQSFNTEIRPQNFPQENKP